MRHNLRWIAWAEVILAAVVCVTVSIPSVLGQATIRSRDLLESWGSAPNLLSPTATAAIPSWNAQPNAWRLGVGIENVDTGVMLTDVEPGMPAALAGLTRGDIILNVEGFQVGYLNGTLYDLGDEIQRRADQQGKINFLVFDSRNRRMKALPLQLVQQSAGGVRGEVVCRERITLSPQAVLTVRLRDVTYPTWQNVTVGQHIIPNPKHPPVPFAIEVDRATIFPDHKYELDAWLVDRGQIVLQSPSAVSVAPLANSGKLQVSLVKVGASVPANSAYAVGQLEQIGQWYRQYLGRAATSQELAVWQSHLQAGRSPQDILAYILGSPEYFDRMGNQRDPFLASVFTSVMGRQPTAADLRQFVTQYQQYGGARTEFVRDVMRLQPAGL